jgi:hypothetical protein
MPSNTASKLVMSIIPRLLVALALLDTEIHVEESKKEAFVSK